MGLVGAGRHPRALRRQTALGGAGRKDREGPGEPGGIPRLHRRDAGRFFLPEVSLLQAPGISPGHLPGGAAVAPERGFQDEDPQGPGGVRGLQGPGPGPGGQRYLLLPLRAPDRDPLLRRGNRVAPDRQGDSLHRRACGGFPQRAEGIGCCEAPRGTLFHHYKVDTRTANC